MVSNAILVLLILADITRRMKILMFHLLKIMLVLKRQKIVLTILREAGRPISHIELVKTAEQHYGVHSTAHGHGHRSGRVSVQILQ